MSLVRKSGLLLVSLNAFMAFSQEMFVVSLRDKNQNEYSMSRPGEFLSEASLARRTKQRIAVTESDLPVSKRYIEQLKNTGAEILLVSKWLNSAVIKTEKDSFIASLPFVKLVEKISSNKTLRKNEQEKAERLFESEFRDFDEAKYYGSAASQNTMLRVEYLHKRGYKGDSVHIALFDAGYRNANNIRGFDSLFQKNQVLETWNFVESKDSVFRVDDGTHGTSVLSCMAANEPNKMVGTSPNAYYSLYVTEDGASETIVEEYNWAVAAEHADSAGAELFSTSLGYTTFDNGLLSHTYADLNGRTTVITRAANAAARVGIVVVNSAGNEGDDAWHYISAPADGDSVLAVGAVKSDRTIANFSSRGPNSAGRVKPDVCAQGANVAVYNPSGNINGSNGTSFSCPILAGAIACLMQAFPDATNMEIANAVVQSAHLFKTPNDDFGYGIPDMAIAYWLLNEQYPKVNNSRYLRVYPNPFTDKLNVYIEQVDAESLTIEVFDMTGKMAITQTFFIGGKNHFYTLEDVSMLKKGVYLLRIKAGAFYETARIVKK